MQPAVLSFLSYHSHSKAFITSHNIYYDNYLYCYINQKSLTCPPYDERGTLDTRLIYLRFILHFLLFSAFQNISITGYVPSMQLNIQSIASYFDFLRTNISLISLLFSFHLVGAYFQASHKYIVLDYMPVHDYLILSLVRLTPIHTSSHSNSKRYSFSSR